MQRTVCLCIMHNLVFDGRTCYALAYSSSPLVHSQHFIRIENKHGNMTFQQLSEPELYESNIQCVANCKFIQQFHTLKVYEYNTVQYKRCECAIVIRCHTSGKLIECEKCQRMTYEFMQKTNVFAQSSLINSLVCIDGNDMSATYFANNKLNTNGCCSTLIANIVVIRNTCAMRM